MRTHRSLNRAGFVAFCVLALNATVTTMTRGDVVITEINYAPVDANGQAQPQWEYVEIFNTGSEAYDLFRYRFTNGIIFEFSQRVFINPRSYIVVCRDVDAVRAKYGISNAVGNFVGALDNGGERLELSNDNGAVVSTLAYNDRGEWPAGAKGTGHTLSILDPYTDPSEPESWTLSSEMGGTPGAHNFAGSGLFNESTIIPETSTWRYFKGRSEPSNPTTAWRQVSFNDSTWQSGNTGIGYGDGDDNTVLTDMQGDYVTVFCRKTFTVSNPSAIDRLVLTVTYDDGFYAYLNGTEVASRNVSGRAYNDDAASAGEPEAAEIDISSFKNRLNAGTNVLAVQVHNAGVSSSDLSFIPKLVDRRPLDSTSSASIVINEGYFPANGTRFVELHNPGGSAVDLSGYHLTNSFADLTAYTFPASTSIPAGGFLAVTEASSGLDLEVIPGTRDRMSIALVNPSATRVIDAYIFEPVSLDMSESRSPDGRGRFAPGGVPTLGAPNDLGVTEKVVFNEIMYHPLSRQELDEWIEFYNAGSSSVDMSGWRVQGIGLTFPDGTEIGPGQFLVVARDPNRVRTRYGLSDSQIVGTAWPGRLANSGERLRLLDENDNPVDSVRFFDGGFWPLWADGFGSSLELIDAESDNEAANMWDASDDSHKASAQMISYSGVPFGGRESDFGMFLAEEGIAIIDDIRLSRTGSATNLIRNGTFDSSTSPWRIEGTHSRSGRTTASEERITGGGSLKLIAWNGGGDYKVNRIEQDTSSQTSGTYTVSFRAKWVVGSPRVITIGDYHTGQPHNPGLAGSNRISTPTQLGTPGAVNSATLARQARHGTSNMGPAIMDVSHSPGVPNGGEPVVVRARVNDPDGVISVRATFRLNNAAASTSSVNLEDPDGDGVYEGTIPGRASGTIVIYHLEAVDAQAQVSRFPPDIYERSNPPVLNPNQRNPRFEKFLLYRHDNPNVSTNFQSYRFVMTTEDQDYLRTRRTLSNEMLEGTFIFGTGDVYYNSKVRFAGSPWLRPGGGTWGKSYSLKFPKDNPLFGRKRAVNLDNHGTDMRERISHYLLRFNASDTKLPYFDFHTMTRFQLNGVHSANLEAIDKPNSQYMSFWFPEDTKLGPFFEMDDRFSFSDDGSRTGNAEGKVQFPPYGSTSGGFNKENYRWYFIPRGRGKTDDDFSPLIQMCRIMDEGVTSNSSFDANIFSFWDVEEVLRVWAIELNIDDWDTWAGNRGKNCYLYQSSTDRLWRKVPWDLELTYGGVGAFSMPGSPTSTYGNHFKEIERMINRPQIKRIYYGILSEQVNANTGFFHSNFLNQYMSRLSGLGRTEIGRPGGFIDQRADRIRGWIRSVIYPQVRLRITTNSGNPFTSDREEVTLDGEAPADVFSLSVRRNGDPVDDSQMQIQFLSSNMTRWRIRNLPLTGGVNDIEIVGFGSRGNLVDSDSIDVTSPLLFNKPELTSVEPPAAAHGDVVTIRGTDFHDGLRVVFGGAFPAVITFDESVDPTTIRATVPSGVPFGVSTVTVFNVDGQETDPRLFTILAESGPTFVRGDANQDGGHDVSDALTILNHLFGGTAVQCKDALDTNDSGGLDVSDGIYLLNFLFGGGPIIKPPYPEPGRDPTDDDLDC